MLIDLVDFLNMRITAFQKHIIPSVLLSERVALQGGPGLTQVLVVGLLLPLHVQQAVDGVAAEQRVQQPGEILEGHLDGGGQTEELRYHG